MKRLARVILLLLCAAIVGALFVALVNAQEATKPPETNHTITPEQAMTLERLVLQRQVLEERAGRLAAESDLLKAQFLGKARELDAAMEQAASAAGVMLQDGWRPDLAGKRWVKP